MTIAESESKAIAETNKQKSFKPITGLLPKTISETMELAVIYAKSGIVPKEMVGKPESVFLAISLGMEIGLPPTQAVTSIMVVNGRPSIWGDALKAVVIGRTIPVYDDSGLFLGDKNICEEFDEDAPDIALKQGYGRCRVKRRGKMSKEVRFSVEDAKRAGLWNKVGPWQQYPGRMLMFRARSWVCRDEFPDLLKGMQIREEVEDIESKYAPTPMPVATEPIPTTAEMVNDAIEPTPEAPVVNLITEEDRKELFRLMKEKNIPMEAFKENISFNYKITSTADITMGILPEIKAWISQYKK